MSIKPVFLATAAGLSLVFGLGQFESASALTFKTIDFNTDNNGPVTSEVIDLDGNAYSDFGVSITVTPNNAGSTLGLFNSNCGPDFAGVPCSGNDSDLATGPTYGTEPQGHVLVINGSDTTVNDDPAGGIITFDFHDPLGAAITSVDLLDIDEVDPQDTDQIFFTFGLVGGGTTGPVTVADLFALDSNNVENLSSIGQTGNNSFYRYSFNGVAGAINGAIFGVESLAVEYDGVSGAVARVSAVPLPAGLPLVMTGLGLFGLIARKRAA